MRSIVTSLLMIPSVMGFVSRNQVLLRNAFTSLRSVKLPTIENLKSKPFMDQVGFASEIVRLFENDADIDDNLLSDMVAAQLSHSDGIRGFFVAYLTGNADQDTSSFAADQDEVPEPLLNAIKSLLEGEKDDKKDLISLACMNVIMPTAMVTMHTDDNLSKSSRRTAERAKIVARTMMDSPEMKKQVLAILCTASGDTAYADVDDSNRKYWEKFYKKWGYKDEQLQDIAKVFQDLNGL